MKIAITTVQTPFVFGGAEYLTQNLKLALERSGHEAEIITLPFVDSRLNYIEKQIIASRMLDIEYSWAGKVDLCIGLKFPAYYIPHNNKVIWMFHQHRAAYELFGTELSNLKDDEYGNSIRNIVINADNTFLSEAKRIFTISNNVTKRLKKNNNIEAQTLYPPCPDMNKYYVGKYDNYVLMPSRINATKRQILAIRAMEYVNNNINLIIIGRPDNNFVKEEMEREIKKRKLSNKIKYLEFVDQNKKIDLYANARAVLFIPVDEDYGLITLEAMSAYKPVITCNDSGGVLEFIRNDDNGLIVEPTPEKLAQAIDTIAEMSEKTLKVMGKNAKEEIISHKISWDNVVKELLK